MSFLMWWRLVNMKKQETDTSPIGKDGLSDLEENAYEAGVRLIHYQSIPRPVEQKRRACRSM